MDKVYMAHYICAGVLFSVTPSGLPASEGVWDYLCYSLLIALALINFQSHLMEFKHLSYGDHKG